MIIFTSFLWLLGWLFALGLGKATFEPEPFLSKGFVVSMLIIWPFYLGYCTGLVLKRRRA